MPQTILIVEDEEKLASLLRDYLEQSAFMTHTIEDGSQVVDWVRENRPSLMLLDLMLPGMNGLEVFKRVREFTDLPIIMITAKVEEVDRLLGLELGADDYICKPFSPREVVSRVKNVLRRTLTLKLNSSHRPIKLMLDKDSYQAKLGDQALSLTKVEFELLQVMAEFPGRVFTRDQLMDRIYSDRRVVNDRTIDSHIKKLRNKLDSLNGDTPQDCIVSVYGLGYKLENS